MNKGIRRGFAITLGAVLQAITGFGAQAIMMRVLLPEDFGQFAIVLAGTSLVQTLLSWRLNILILRLPPGDLHSPLARLYQKGLVWETVAAALCSLAWMSATNLLTPYAALLLVGLTLGQWGNQSLAFYERDMAYGRIATVETGSQMCGHVVAVVMVLSGSGPIALYTRELVAILSRLVAFCVLRALPAPLVAWPKSQDLKSLCRGSLGIWLEGVLEGSFSRLVILTTGTLTSLHDAGILAQSQRLALLPHQFMTPVISRFAVNLFNRTDNNQRRLELMIKLLSSTTIILILTIIVTVTLADQLVPWIFGPQWAEAGDALKSLGGLILFMPLFDLFRSYFYAAGNIKSVIIARLAQILVFMALIALTYVSGHGALGVMEISWSLSFTHAVSFGTLAIGFVLLYRTHRA